MSIVAGVSSLFRWQNNIDSAQEHLMIIKTRNALLSEVVSLVKELHSYTIPEIIALPVVGGNPAYLEWIDKETC